MRRKKACRLRGWLIELKSPPFGRDHHGYLTIARMGAPGDAVAEQIVGW